MRIIDERDQVTITANFTYEVYRSPSSDWCCAKFRDCETSKEFHAIGNSLPNKKTIPYLLTGRWGINKKTGQKQFEVAYVDIAKVSEKDGVIAYLRSLKCGIGKVKAEAIFNKFGAESFDIIDNDPERLMSIPGISRKRVEQLKAGLQNANASRDVIKLVQSAGVNLSGSTIHSLIEHHPEDTLSWLCENPYRALDIDGYTFDKADAIAAMLGIPDDSPMRLEAGVIKVLDDAAQSGHVCLPIQKLIDQMVHTLKSNEDACKKAIRACFDDKRIMLAKGHLYTPKRFDCEVSLCNNITRLEMANPAPITNVDPFIEEYEKEFFALADSQKEAVRKVFKNSISIITGGPGTGKTTVTKAVLYVNKKIYGESAEPILLAPTGRAARRMSDATGYPAQTIHSAVGWRGDDTEITDDSMLGGNLVIVDESSMMDQNIANILLSKVESSTRVVFVGDVDQLPSVGCGNVLNDLIQSNRIPTTRLNVIFRQAQENPIVANAHAINSGNPNITLAKTFKFYETHNEKELFDAACKMYLKCVKAYGDDKVILLNPQRNNTEVSVDNFNKALQEKLNPHKENKYEIKIGSTVFREGDKVMELKNTEGPKNGDVGYIREITCKRDPDDPDSISYFANIEFNNDGVTQEYNTDDLRHVTLAYCTTVHKAQGSEYETVLMVVSKAHPSLLQRRILYTGITRARVNCALFGELDALQIAVSNDKTEERSTLLAERIQRALA